jgi:hypothetical protein
LSHNLPSETYHRRLPGPPPPPSPPPRRPFPFPRTANRIISSSPTPLGAVAASTFSPPQAKSSQKILIQPPPRATINHLYLEYRPPGPRRRPRRLPPTPPLHRSPRAPSAAGRPVLILASPPQPRGTLRCARCAVAGEAARRPPPPRAALVLGIQGRKGLTLSTPPRTRRTGHSQRTR